MNKRKHIVKPAVLLFMVFAMILSTSKTFAYWSNDISVTESNHANATVRVGEWTQIFEWQPDMTYYEGERVTYNGFTYVAKKRNRNIRPESRQHKNWPSYWQML